MRLDQIVFSECSFINKLEIFSFSCDSEQQFCNTRQGILKWRTDPQLQLYLDVNKNY